MRIAFVTHYSNLYGANHSLLSLIDGLIDYGVDSHVLVPEKGPITQELTSRNIPFYVLPFKPWMSHNRWKAPARLALNLALLPPLSRKLRQWDIDLIHTNSSVTPVGALLAEMLSLPHVWHVREFGQRDFDLYYDWGEKLSRAFMSRSDATIAVSESVQRQVLSDVDTRSYVVYDGVISKERLEELSIRNKESTKKIGSPFTFAIVGQIHPAKGQKEALGALHQLKQEGNNIHLLIAGDGTIDNVEELHRFCSSLGLHGAVSFLGYVSDPFEVYSQADAVLMCSPHEAMGRVTVEAMAAGCPVIGYNSDGTAELIDHEKNGLLYNGGTKNLSDSMRRLVDSPGWAKSLGNNGPEKVKETFTNEVYVDHVLQVFREVKDEESARKVNGVIITGEA